jgi:hypothetical protein
MLKSPELGVRLRESGKWGKEYNFLVAKYLFVR